MVTSKIEIGFAVDFVFDTKWRVTLPRYPFRILRETGRKGSQPTGVIPLLIPVLLSQYFGQEGEGISSPRPDAKKQRERNALNLVPALAGTRRRATICLPLWFTVARIRQRCSFPGSDIVNLTMSCVRMSIPLRGCGQNPHPLLTR